MIKPIRRVVTGHVLRPLERATQCVGLFEECSHAIDECVGTRRPIIVCRGQNGTRGLGRPFTGWVPRLSIASRPCIRLQRPSQRFRQGISLEVND